MGARLCLEPDRSEPLGLWLREIELPPNRSDVRELRFELSNRGDRVPGRLLLPAAAAGPFPLVLLQHGGGGSKESPYLDATALPWVRSGAAVGSIDFPLHGERASAKLTRRLLEGLAGEFGRGSRSLPEPFWKEVVQQSVLDLRRTLDALETQADIDASRAAYAGFSLGAILGASFCAADPRPRAAALAVGGGGLGPADLDPTAHIGGFAPRPILFVNATRDEWVPRRATEALFEAAGEPKKMLWFDATHTELPGAALKAMWEFLREQLALGPDSLNR